jgi:hypothetical protein
MTNYVITAAQASYWDKDGESVRRGPVAKLNNNLYDGLERLCQTKNAELIILPMNGKDARETLYHESLGDIEIFEGNYDLNSNIKISDMKVPPQNIDPATGRTRFAQADQTMIYAHSKQRLKAVPSSNSKLPKLLMTTGSITSPNYQENNHRGDVATRDHTLGAIMVEVIDDKLYHARHITAFQNGNFVDMGLKYSGKKRPTTIKTDSLVIGDLHVGETDPETMRANYEMIDHFKPERVILHDTFNGHSINHHERNNRMSQIRAFNEGHLSLEGELREYTKVLNEIAEASPGEVYIVKSNHDMFLNRYLEEGKFLKEPHNADIAMRLGYSLVQGRDPLKDAVGLMGGIPKNVHFLDLNSDLKRWGYQLASHGHKGLGGSRNANINARETAHGKSITGHSHTPEKLRNTYIVGTSTHLNLPYTDGSASSWMNCNAVLYKGGLVQLLPIIEGKWKKD